jgi:hypothetical protein
MNKRPLTVTLLSWLLIAVGVSAIAYYLTGIRTQHLFQFGQVLILFVNFIWIVCGAFMLRGDGWARWIALAWIALHAVLSFFHSMHQAVAHAIIFVLIGCVLFRPEVRAYFRHERTTGAA